jgi:selenocysteine-specific elongation factor
MPQTREHLAVLRTLGVRHGAVAITKADIAAAGPVIAGPTEVLPDMEAMPVAAPAGVGLEELLAALYRAVAGLPDRAARAARRACTSTAPSPRGDRNGGHGHAMAETNRDR